MPVHTILLNIFKCYKIKPFLHFLAAFLKMAGGTAESYWKSESFDPDLHFLVR